MTRTDWLLVAGVFVATFALVYVALAQLDAREPDRG